MIVQEYVEMSWNPRSKKHYMDKGYIFTKYKEKFNVKVEDLNPSSELYVKARCINCGEIEAKKYKSIYYSLNETYKKSFHCTKCRGIGVRAEIDAKQKLGLLSPGDNGYFSYTENIEKTLKEYIEKYGTVDGLVKNYSSLNDAIQQKDSRSLYEIVTDIGYNFKEVSSIMPNRFYEDFDKVREEIEPFIIECKRFPEVEEVVNELRINGRAIAFHGGMEGLRQKMGYIDEILIDDSGYRNRSIFEFKVAQFLIHNNIFAKRDIAVFDGERYTCDFVLESIVGEKYYIECWGYEPRDNHPLADSYTIRKSIKKKLYEDNTMNLIDIDLSDTQNMNQEKFQEYLKGKFESFIDKELIVFKNVEFLDIENITNDEILDAVMSYSSNENYLPTQDYLISKTGYQYATIIKQRFGGYGNFANHYGKKQSLGKSKTYNK